MWAALRALPSHRHCPLRRLVSTIHLRRMSAQPQASRVRAAPDSGVELPEAKKARLASGTPPTIVQDDVSAPAQAEGVQLPKRSKRKHKHARPDLPEPCSAEDVLWHEIKAVLGPSAIEKATEEGAEFDSPFAFLQEVEVVVKSLSPSGELRRFSRRRL
jgi:tRNA (uracil-5-)-methyltransferase